MKFRTPLSLVQSSLLSLTLLITALPVNSQIATDETPLDKAPLDEAPQDSAAATVYYRWIGQQGGVRFTDFEPEGVPSVRVEPETERASEDASLPMLERARGPVESAIPAGSDNQVVAITHIGPCADARRLLALLHTNLPTYRNASGSYTRSYPVSTSNGSAAALSGEQRSAAISVARSSVLQNCSDPAAFAEEQRLFGEGEAR